MQISKEEIIHIAKLASLNLTDSEIEKYTEDMKGILDFANTVNAVNTDNLNETIGIGNRCNVFRKDEIKEFKDNDLLLENAPSKDQNMFKIPKVVDRS